MASNQKAQTTTPALAPQPQTGALQTQGEQKPNMSERFTSKVMMEFGSSVGAIQVTDYQRQLIQGYFVAIDRALKAAEEERLRKNENNRDHKYDNPLPITWENVNLNDLALDVVHYARMGLDMMQKNHLFAIPFKNNKPCFYAEKAGHTAHWYGDRTQSTTWKATLRDEDGTATTLTGGIVITDGEGNKLYLTSEPPKGKKIRRIRLQKGRSVYLYQPDGKTTDTWEVTKDAHVDHPTQKPVELAIRAINNNTKPGDLVIDFFGGSGSTLRAAEMTGRRCYTLELDPRYCDLIVKGYIALTGDVSVVCERDGARIACTDLFDLSV